MTALDVMRQAFAYIDGFSGVDIIVNPSVKPGTVTKMRGIWSRRTSLVFHSNRERDLWLVRMGLLVKVKRGRGQRRNRRNRR